ncbi:hypothetical protein ACA910_012797 [Epithemia clementina (nom. ined.)]
MVILENTSAALVIGLSTRRFFGSVASRTNVVRKTAIARWFSSPDMSDSGGEYETTYHAPVMWKECVSALLESNRFKSRVSGEGHSDPVVFVDGTLGGGGHSSALLEHLSAGDVVIGCDMDSAALNAASDRLSEYLGSQHEKLPLFVPVRSNFCELASVLPTLQNPLTNSPILGSEGLVDGILLDLGVSSYQINTADRGFAFMKDGPLDMRMSDEARFNAADICNEFDVNELASIFKEYGDEPRARAIAQSIVKQRPLRTTSDLVRAVAAVTPEFNKKSRRMGRTATLARVFQSIRIVVNEEDKALEKALMHMSPSLLRPGGRLVVMSYHSIEDRAVKRVMRYGNISANEMTVTKDMYGNPIGPPRPFRCLGKPTKAGEDEVARNSRARSAILRIAERQ